MSSTEERLRYLLERNATIASRFVKEERSEETEQVMSALARSELELADVKRQLAVR